jgi:P-type Ca2+ transporter type 2C
MATRACDEVGLERRGSADLAVPAAAAGLTSAEAARRLLVHGRNEIIRAEGPSPWALLAGQFRSALIALLLVAGGVAAALGEVVDAVAIGAIVLLNATIGFLQEYRAQRAVQALRALSAPKARVLRDGHAVSIPTAEVIEGDLLLLEAGDMVAADARLMEAHALETIESALTGESLPVEKRAEPVPAGAPLAERSDRVFLGTAVASGRGVAVVEATGMASEMGGIARLLATASDSATPLQQQLQKVGRTLLGFCVAVVALVFALYVARGFPWLEVVLASVSLAVAAVPEGLPAIVTVALALGVQRMAGRNALVRRLSSVETLGCTTVICTDKTGTLTTGRMEVRDLVGPDHHALLFAAAACCDGELGDDGNGVGDPTELALLRAASPRGIRRADIERDRPRVAEQPFDSRRKRMSVWRADGVLYVKGAPEVVVDLCSEGAAGALAASERLAGSGLRVLAVATGHEAEEKDLRLVGLIGLADPPRTEAVDAVANARQAGIRTVMITGDHPVTAHAIARELGIVRPDEDGAGRIHARVTAEDKIRIVRDLKRQGEVVAMTGDGVNDAPALREADIGIAMGRGGTEVAREAADMVLTDDNFATIVAAVEEGRGIYSNIRKTIVYLLGGNVAELAVMLLASLAGLPLPLIPLQLLWVNLVTDGLPALALVMDPPPRDALTRPPRPPAQAMLGVPEWRRILSIGALESAVVLSAFVWSMRDGTVEHARGVAFSTLVFCEVFRAFTARSRRLVYWQVGVFTNVHLLAVVAFSAILQLALPYVPTAARLLHLDAMHFTDSAVALALGLVPVSLLEMGKLLVGRRR